MTKVLNHFLFGLIALMAGSCAHTNRESSRNAPTQPHILARSEWKANPPILAMQTNLPRYITIHHTGTTSKPTRSLIEKMQGLQQFSQHEDKLASGKLKLAWPDVPYHFYIDCHGDIAEGRELNYVGDTNTEYNPSGHILVVLEGNFENEQPTPEQLVSTQRLVSWLAYRWHVPASQIKGHQDYAETLCPGKNLESRLAELRNAANQQ